MSRHWSLRRRVVVSAITGTVCSLFPAGISRADAPGPTDYSSTIVDIRTADDVPLPEGVEISVEGHDAFLAVRVSQGTVVEVPGYEGEPYLTISSDCTVFENQQSMSTWYNQDRFGSDVDQSLVDHDAPPDWERIGSSCTVAWHDHRLHYMSSTTPVNAEPGDILVSDSIPLIVNGIDVNVNVESRLMAGPDPVVPIVAAIASLGLVIASWRRSAISIAVLLAAITAMIVGAAQYTWSIPETGPQLTAMLIPALALLASGWLVLRSQSPSAIIKLGAELLGSGFLLIWAWRRSSVLTSALLPTSLPYWLDRASTTAVTLIALAGITHSVISLMTLSPSSANVDG